MAPRRAVLKEPPWVDWRRLIFLAALLCLPMSTFASRARALLNLGSDAPVLRPGQELTLSWSTLPEGAEEFELLLICESPMPINLRLTTCLDPRLRTYRWRVPNLPCDVARFRIRVGVEGEELTWAWSAPFRIAWQPRGPLAEVSLEGGEFWLSEVQDRADLAFLDGPDSADSGALPARRETLALPPQSRSLLVPSGSAGGSETIHRQESPLRPCAREGTDPSFTVPLRI